MHGFSAPLIRPSADRERSESQWGPEPTPPTPVLSATAREVSSPAQLSSIKQIFGNTPKWRVESSGDWGAGSALLSPAVLGQSCGRAVSVSEGEGVRGGRCPLSPPPPAGQGALRHQSRSHRGQGRCPAPFLCWRSGASAAGRDGGVNAGVPGARAEEGSAGPCLGVTLRDSRSDKNRRSEIHHCF